MDHTWTLPEAITPQDWADDYELASDEEMEAYYFSSAAGRARVVIGNRRFGEGGYVSGGRRLARATNPVPRGRHNSGKVSDSIYASVGGCVCVGGEALLRGLCKADGLVRG